MIESIQCTDTEMLVLNLNHAITSEDGDDEYHTVVRWTMDDGCCFKANIKNSSNQQQSTTTINQDEVRSSIVNRCMLPNQRNWKNSRCFQEEGGNSNQYIEGAYNHINQY